MLLAGVQIRDALVLELAILLRRREFADTADTLEGAVAALQTVVALTISDRVAILNVLDSPPAGLEDLRATLLAEHVGRERDDVDVA